MENILNEMLELIRKKMRESGSYERGAYREFIDESIVYFRERGKITDEESDKFIQTRLMHMYDSVIAGMTDEQ